MIYYIGYFDVQRNGAFIRSVSPAAVRKMEYIAQTLETLGHTVKIISPAIAVQPGTVPALCVEETRLSDGITLVNAPMLPVNCRRLQTLNARFARIWLSNYLCKNLRPEDTVILYHTPALAPAVCNAITKRRAKFILEVEEIYSRVWKLKKSEENNEKRLLSCCNGKAILVSEALKSKLGFADGIVSYGSYRTYPGILPEKEHNRDNVMLLFSGGIEKTRGGAFSAIEVMRYLPENYSLTISGSMDNSSKDEFFSKIENINTEKGFSCVQYVGMLPQSEFEEQLLRADIALNLQKEGEYGGFLFPSKILTYLSYNLPVVSTPGESICQSELSSQLYITSDYHMENIAEAIQTVNLEEVHDYRNVLQKMDADFREKLEELIR